MPSEVLTLPDEVRESVMTRVRSGLYRDEGEVLRAAIRSLEREEAEEGAKLTALRAAIQEGLDSGIVEGDVFAQIHEELGLPKRAA
jgi:antitoxin ParD1/3/4